MHASRSGTHISGAERLLEQPDIAEEELLKMLRRAWDHPRGRADEISLQVEEVAASLVMKGRLLDLSGFRVDNWEQGRSLAQSLLAEAGVAPNVATEAMSVLHHGAAPGGVSMRGAMLVDADTGARLETNHARGVRVSRMDVCQSLREKLSRQLAMFGLDRPQVVEALTLASKVSSTSQVLAELCWSDDPDYTAGYVASSAGYRRITQLKPLGEERGGRVFFIRSGAGCVADLVDFLERTPYLFTELGQIEEMRQWKGC